MRTLPWLCANPVLDFTTCPVTNDEACPFASYFDNNGEIATPPAPPAHVGHSIFGRRWCSASNRHQCSATRRIFFASSADSQGIRCCCCHFGGSFVNAPDASAAVYVDPDRYGDKELKSATVNRLRQTIRDVLLKDATLAPCLLKIAIYDALRYNASTNEEVRTEVLYL